MPSQFQPNYPRRTVPQGAATKPLATGSTVVKSLGDLAQAIQKAKAAQALTNQPPDSLGNLGDEAFINQTLAQTPAQIPAQAPVQAAQPALDNLGALGDEDLINQQLQGSYY